MTPGGDKRVCGLTSPATVEHPASEEVPPKASASTRNLRLAPEIKQSSKTTARSHQQPNQQPRPDRQHDSAKIGERHQRRRATTGQA